MKQGKVWLVGAGPGDIGLFTLKGMEILSQADVVVYDSLVGQGVLAKVPSSARLINVGKRADRHTMKQEQINQVLLEEAQKGYRVVRLKGGDPFLFGRGGEELELLTANGIPYEVVPGVTSSIAVPAYNGIPVTHRDFCSSVHIITGHRRAGREYDIDFQALVNTRGTLVFLMGIAALNDICRDFWMQEWIRRCRQLCFRKGRPPTRSGWLRPLRRLRKRWNDRNRDSGNHRGWQGMPAF